MKGVSDDHWMRLAIEEAEKAFQLEEVPVGAVIVKDGQVISASHNTKEKDKSVLSHAELIAIERASRILGDWRLMGCTLFTTMEPCIMCVGAIYHSRMDRVVYGCPDVRWGGLGSVVDLSEIPSLNHRFTVTPHQLKNRSSDLLRSFFKRVRGYHSEGELPET